MGNVAKAVNLGRRRFLVATAATGGGLALGFSTLAAADVVDATAAPGAAPEFDAWLVISPDNVVTIRVPTPEIGNGAATQLAMTITEELHCDWTRVKLEFASATRDYVEDNVYSKPTGALAFFGGRSTVAGWNSTLLRVGASARERLKAAAAAQWHVPVAEVEASNSVVSHRATKRSLSYGQLAHKAVLIKLEQEPAIKSRSEWTFLGKATPSKLHLPKVVNGTAQYGIDLRLPGMLYAALMQSPVQDGKLKSVDFDKIKDWPGVHGIAVIEGGEPLQKLPLITQLPREMNGPRTSAIAVVADHYWQARTALAALPVEWEDGDGAKWKTTEQVFEAAQVLIEQPGGIVQKSLGNAAEVLAKQPKIVEAIYTSPYCDHVAMEPLNGTALVTADRVEIWHPTQAPKHAHRVAAEESGLAPEKVFVHPTLVGGGFGRRIGGDDVRMAVAVAKQFPGRPIHTIWSREETTRQGRYRPLLAVSMKAGLDASGMPQAFIAHEAGRAIDAGQYTDFGPLASTIGLSDASYTSGIIPNVQVESHTLPIHIRTGPYRGPGYNSNAFFLESFIDECAHAAAIDPLEYRLKLHASWPDPGWTLCLKEAAKQAGWGKKLRKGMAQGIAIGNFGMLGQPKTGTVVCVVATVEVSKKGVLRVDTLDAAFDCGRMMNRDAVRAQMEGGLTFGLNMSLNEMLTIKDGRIVEGNYDQYPMLRIGDMPKLRIHFGGLSDHDRYSETGEPPAGPVGPAIANAIFRITGKRIRSTPFRVHDLSWT